MAQVIEKYRAVARGSSTMYYYRYADYESDATRIYSGEGFYLHKNYRSRESNGMYLMIDPSGWIPFYYVDDIEPCYETITDACTAPSSVALDTKTKLLTITGGAGGDLNSLTGFGISCRDRSINSTAWGAWSSDLVTDSRSITVSVDSGMIRQFRVRTRGSAGSSYYSAYTVCETLLNGNTAAGTPTILLPVSGTETCADTAVFKVECPAEPDGDDMVLQRCVDGGAWETAANLESAGGTVYDQLSLPEGSHTVCYQLVDSKGEAGGVDSITYSRTSLVWSRTINTGDIISNREISFVADINELLAYVNKLRVFYGKAPIALPGTPGLLADWHKQLVAMQNAVDSCRTATNREAYGFELPSGWPKAYRINQLREAIQST